jgi:restriction system protein
MDGGKYAEYARRGGYVAIGWDELGDLSWLKETTPGKGIDELKKKCKITFPKSSGVVVGLTSAQIFNFVMRLKKGDIILTPSDGNLLLGEVTGDYFYVKAPEDGCPFSNRRPISWKKEVPKDKLSERLRSTLYAWQTIFSLEAHALEIDQLLGKRVAPVIREVAGPEVVSILSERLLELEPRDFQEKLIPELLKAMGFEADASPTYTSDGGIDVRGKFRISVFTGDVRLQLKRVKQNITPSLIRELRGSLSVGEQGVFVTTSNFTKDAIDEAKRVGATPIFLVNGEELAKLILTYYDSLSDEVKMELEKRFGLKKTFMIQKVA